LLLVNGLVVLRRQQLREPYPNEVPVSKREALSSDPATRRLLFEQDFVSEEAESKNNVQLTPSDNSNPFLYSATCAKKTKTYNSGDSLVVTHLTTNSPVSCLDRAERTGSLAFTHPRDYYEIP
jgi:hypothetical protein